jgi:hypothetical protein
MRWPQWLTGFLRRLPRFERRWIADPEKREQHDQLVRRRLGITRRKKPRT